ncbi:hypothetical protein [Euzebya sp.]|uniref:hypothetical protein n=1 Tax=Euzebya sp. TaxID=1971409 RepID=UPI003514FC85
MAVTDDERAVLGDHLDRVLGTEAARIMMAHLPRGGADEVATKQDIADLRTELQRFATKDDLQRFATKADLERFATKDDLERFATKADLANLHTVFHTKDEHAAFRAEVNERFAAQESLLLQLLERVIRIEGALTSVGHELRAELRGELNAAITGQTRAVIISLFGMVVVLCGFMFALLQATQP